VYTHNLAFIHRIPGRGEHPAPFLQIEQCETQYLPLAIGDQHSVFAWSNTSMLGRTIVIEYVVHKTGARGGGHELSLETDQATRGNNIVETYPPFAIRHHILQLTLAATQGLHQGTLMLLFYIHRELLIRFTHFTLNLTEDHLRTGDCQLEALTAHSLQQYRKMQFTTARDLEFFRVGALFHSQRHIMD